MQCKAVVGGDVCPLTRTDRPFGIWSDSLRLYCVYLQRLTWQCRGNVTSLQYSVSVCNKNTVSCWLRPTTQVPNCVDARTVPLPCEDPRLKPAVEAESPGGTGFCSRQARAAICLMRPQAQSSLRNHHCAIITAYLQKGVKSLDGTGGIARCGLFCPRLDQGPNGKGVTYTPGGPPLAWVCVSERWRTLRR